MICAYLWNLITPHGIYVCPTVKSSIASLQDLIVNLGMHDCTLVSMNEEGIIVSDESMSSRIDDVHSRITSLDAGLMSQDTRLEVLEGKYGTSPLEQKVEIIPEKDDSGEALYIMWDLIPEELKKKLTIYIKKL